MTIYSNYYYSATSSHNDSLLVSLFIAALLHIVVVLGINFSAPEPEQIDRSIEITLINTPVKNEPKQAKFLAQENQTGAGEKSKKPEPPPQRLPSEGNSQKQHIAKSSVEQNEPKQAKKLIAQEVGEKKITPEKKAETIENDDNRPHLSAESLQQQIAQLGTEIRLKQQSADDTKIKFVNSVSAHKYIAAQYVKDWESKVERTGNLNYPDVAAKKNFSATLTMDVGIKSDGTIYSIRISKSSGNTALDDAAKRIVRMSAPFAPLPSELLKELNVLVITRVWKFSDESGFVTN